MSYNANHAAPGCGSDDATPCTCGTCARCLSRAGDGRAGATAPTTTDRLAEIEARWLKATPGPWEVDGGLVYSPEHPTVCQMFNRWDEDFDNHVANGDALAAAPDDVAWLCAEVERLRAALTRLGGAHE